MISLFQTPNKFIGREDLSINSKKIAFASILDFNGRGERIRTSDPIVPNDVRYQAAPLPVPQVSAVFWTSPKFRYTALAVPSTPFATSLALAVVFASSHPGALSKQQQVIFL